MPIDAIEDCILENSNELSLQYSGEDPADLIVEIAEALRCGRIKQPITVLDLGGNNMAKAHAEMLVDLVLPHLASLTEIDLRHNDLESEGIIILRTGLEKHCRALQSIDVTENRVRDVGAREVAGLLLGLPHLSSIRLGSNQLTPKCVPSLLVGLKNAACLTYLGLEFNGLGDAGTIELLNGIRGKCLSLRAINLSDSCVGDEAMIKAIAPFIAASRSEQRVRHFDLSVNKIGVDGALAFANALKKATSLTSFDLGCNPIGEAGGLAIAGALEKGRVGSIDLTATEMTVAVIERLRASILANPLIHRVRTGSNDRVPDQAHNELLELVRDRPEPDSDTDSGAPRPRGMLPNITTGGPDLAAVSIAVTGVLLALVAWQWLRSSSASRR